MADRGEAPATFQIAPEQGVFMQLLTRAIRARRAIEIGTFTGFSALCIARGLPDDGSLLCLDRSEEWTAVARRYWARAGRARRGERRRGGPPPRRCWARAGLAGRIELRRGEALAELRALPGVETFDLAFVDADKT